LPEQRGGYTVSPLPTVSSLSRSAYRSAYMSADSISFAFGLAAGFALFGVMLKTVWKRL
jgi:hypothetical protein